MEGEEAEGEPVGDDEEAEEAERSSSAESCSATRSLH